MEIKLIKLLFVKAVLYLGIISYLKIKLILIVISILNCRIFNGEKLDSVKVSLTIQGHTGQQVVYLIVQMVESIDKLYVHYCLHPTVLGPPAFILWMEHGSAVAIDFTSITYTSIDFGRYIKLPIVRFLQNTKLTNRLISMLSIFFWRQCL